MRSRETSLLPIRTNNALLGPETDRSLSVLSEATPLRRLQEAGKGGRKVDPDDVLGVLAGIAAEQASAARDLQERLSELMQMLLANASSSPAATLALIERLSKIHLQQQAQVERTLALLHQLVTPAVPPVVNVVAVNTGARSVRPRCSSKTHAVRLAAVNLGGAKC